MKKIHKLNFRKRGISKKLKEKKYAFLGFTFIVIVNMTYTLCFLTPYKDFSENNVSDKPNTSNYFELTPFRIPNDYTWAQAAMQPWCSGAGTENNPYIISNVKIDAHNQIAYCLSIESSSVFFQIKNSIFYNSESGGIKLRNVQNGEILNNTCYDNHYGIIVDNSNNILMENNYVKGNYYGIGIYDTFYSDLLHSTILNSYDAIDLYHSDNNVISDCVITNNTSHGLHIYDSFNNKLTFNSFSYNKIRGIMLSHSDSNTFDQNTFISNDNQAIQFLDSSYNLFTKNIIRDHSTAILVTSQSNENSILNNRMINNKNCIRIDTSCKGNVRNGNICVDNLTIIIIITSVTSFIGIILEVIMRKIRRS